MRTNERLTNLGAASMKGDILDRQLTQTNDIDFVKIEVKYHLELPSTTTNQIHFLDKIVILLGLQMKKNIYFNLFFMND